MIVKTGANYQADGGYIEASRDGDKVTIATDGESVVIPDINGELVDTLEFAQLSKDPSFSGTITLVGVLKTATIYYMSGFTVGTSIIERGIFHKIGTTITITGNIPELKEGSKNCVIRSDATTGLYQLYATGPNPIAILGVA